MIFLIFVFKIKTNLAINDVLLKENELKHKEFQAVHENMITRQSFIKIKPSDPNKVHELVIQVESNNIVSLEDMLAERSNPNHKSYQQWLSYDEVNKRTSNNIAVEEILLWLQAFNVTGDVLESSSSYIKAAAPIYVLEEMLNTTFFHWQDVEKEQHLYYDRAKSYSIPKYLHSHIKTIFKSCQVPTVVSSYGRVRKNDVSLEGQGVTQLDLLNKIYNISSNDGKQNLYQ